MKMVNNISYILIGLSLNVNKDTRTCSVYVVFKIGATRLIDLFIMFMLNTCKIFVIFVSEK